jgi:glycine oxidase
MSSSGAGVLIIGGGLIGSSIAWRLAQRNIRVTVADAGGFAEAAGFHNGEASTAGAGMLSPGGEFAKPSPWVELGVESLRLYPRFVEELTVETGIDVDFRICGGRHLDADIPESRIDFQRRAGIRVQRTEEGLYYPDDGIVDPAALLRALRSAAVKRGVKVETRQISSVNADVYDAVVVAAGAWSSSLQISFAGQSIFLPEATPVKGHLIGYQMQPGLMGPFLHKMHTYVLQRSDGFVIAGTTEESVGFDTRVDRETCQEIHRRAAEMVRELGAVQPARCWIGFRPGPELLERGPHMGRAQGSGGRETNVWLAYGHYRNGILLTPVTAARISNEIVNALRGV